MSNASSPVSGVCRIPWIGTSCQLIASHSASVTSHRAITGGRTTFAGGSDMSRSSIDDECFGNGATGLALSRAWPATKAGAEPALQSDELELHLASAEPPSGTWHRMPPVHEGLPL